jgi:hypothetical protein
MHETFSPARLRHSSDLRRHRVHQFTDDAGGTGAGSFRQRIWGGVWKSDGRRDDYLYDDNDRDIGCHGRNDFDEGEEALVGGFRSGVGFGRFSTFSEEARHPQAPDEVAGQTKCLVRPGRP